jgi:RHS repeat-associated protein
LAADVVTPLPNQDGGIYIGGFPGAWIGGTQPDAANTIAHNGGPGIHFPGIYDSNYTFRRGRPQILGNSIHSNAELGISRANTVQQNDAGDANLFTTYLDNYPVLSAILVENGMTHIGGSLDTYKPQNCLIEIFANDSRDPSNYGEGERWLVSLFPESDGTFDIVLPEDLSGRYLTATSTRRILESGDPSSRTSEFSRAVLVGNAVNTNLPPQIVSSPPTSVVAEDAYVYPIAASDPEGGDLTYSLALAPNGMSIDAAGVISWTPTTQQEGRHAVTIVVRDELGLFASQNFSLLVLPFVDLDPPVISIGIPEGLVIENPYELSGTICDPYLVGYTIEISPLQRNQWVAMGDGDACVLNGLVGVLDPTRLANGLYDLRIAAVDESGHEAVFEAVIEVGGRLKVGQFELAFEDIAIPVSGLPISVIRTYHSFDKEPGDFGVGWDMTLASGLKLQVTRTLGDSWHAEEDYFFDPGNTGQGSWVYKLETPNVPKVLITYADGRQDRFEFRPDFVTQPALDPRYVAPYFVPLEGTHSTLEAIADTDLILYPWPAYPNGEQLLDSDLNVYDPDLYRLTTAEGMQLLISETTGLQSVTDRNGNTLTFDPNGITHSSGLAIEIQRDADGRITQIVDPAAGTVTYAYDDAGDLIEFVDQAGGLMQMSYDDQHNLVSIIDPNGRESLRLDYDDEGRLIGTSDALGNATTLLHDTNNAVEYVIDRLGNTTAYTYDTNGNVIAITDPEGYVTTFTYDDEAKLLSKTDALGNTTLWTYDAVGNMLTETDPLGNTHQWSYNDRKQIRTDIDPLGNTSHREYDARGNLIAFTNAVGETVTYTYEAEGDLASMTDCRGNTTTYTYDSYGRKISEIDPLGNQTIYTYDVFGNEHTRTQARTVNGTLVIMTTTKEYDLAGRLTASIDPNGHIERYEYDAAGRRVATVDQNGNRTTFTYDDAGRLALTIYPDGTTANNSYDALGNRVAFTDRAGNITQLEYAASRYGDGSDSLAMNRLIRILHPDGSSTGMEYDAAGRISARIDENGNRTEYAYDGSGRIIRTIDALGQQTSFFYDANGNRISDIDTAGRTKSFLYDALNRRIGIGYPDGTNEFTQYTAGCGEEWETSVTNTGGDTTQFEYDALGRLTKVIDALGGESIYTYDEVGNRVTQTNARGYTTKFTYDNLGRMIGRTLPLGESEGVSYDPRGNIISKTDFNGATTTYSYDTMNRLVSVTYPDASTVLFSYTLDGRRASATDARGITTYAYDARGRLVSANDPDGMTLSYAYDPRGNRIELNAPSGTTAYTHDALNRLLFVTDSRGRSTSYTYDAGSNLSTANYPNGGITSYTYDALDHPLAIEHRDSVGGLVASYAYIYDASGNRTLISEGGGRTVSYAYDALSRVTEESVTDTVLGNETIFYAYDAVGNRTHMTDSSGTTAYTYDANDRLLSENTPSGMFTYLYDDNGNLIQRTWGTDSVNYGFNHRDQLISVEDAFGRVDHLYDVDGIRVESVSGAEITRFVVDKNRPFAEVLEERDGAGMLVFDYVHGADLIGQNSASGTSYYIFDGGRSVRALTDESLNVTDRYDYDSYGVLTHRSGISANRYLYRGERYDEESELYYLRMRHYDPSIGRFLSHDPFKGDPFKPETLHRYLYASANPVNLVDPSGQFSMPELAVTLAVAGIVGELSSAVWAPFSHMVGGSRGQIEWSGDYMIGTASTSSVIPVGFGGGVAAAYLKSECFDQWGEKWQAQGLWAVTLFGLSTLDLPLDFLTVGITLGTPALYGLKPWVLSGPASFNSGGLSLDEVSIGLTGISMGTGTGYTEEAWGYSTGCDFLGGVSVPVPGTFQRSRCQ